MSWQTNELWPMAGEPKGKPVKSPSPPLARILGFAGFGVAVVLSLKCFRLLFHLSADFLNGGHWGFRETLAFGVATIAGTLGGLMGSGAGLYVNVTNTTLNRFLAIFWHSVANGQLICFMMLGLVLGKTHHLVTMDEAIKAFGGAMVACTAIALLLFILGQFRDGRRSNMLLCCAVSIALSLRLTSYLEQLFKLSPTDAMVMGVAYGVFLVLSVAYFVQRDYAQLDEIRRMDRKR